MTPLAGTILKAILSLTGPQQPAGDYLDLLATDIAMASLEAQSPLQTPLQRALALVAIARTESRFAPEVLSCAKRGDLGEVTAFQLMPTKRHPLEVLGIPIRDLCPTNQASATLALRVLDRPCAKHGANLRGMFRGYAAGSCGTKSDVATKQYDTYVQLRARYDHE